MKHITSSHKLFGKSGEEIVVTFLKQQGYNILAQNFFCRYGELDIIATKDDVLACVEVKTRNTKTEFMHDLVPASKQKKMIMTARHYISTLSRQYAVRFDVAFVVQEKIEYIEGAFTPADSY